MSWSRGLVEARRRHALASDKRAGSWARGRARTAQREFIRENWQWLSIFAIVVVGIALLSGFLMPSAFMKGLVVGAAMAATPMAVWVLAMQITGSAPIMMGDQAEQWTAQELRRLSRRGWRLVNHFVLGADDIDHVLIGPDGAFVFETKWSGSPWQSGFGVARQRNACAQAHANARRLQLWQPFRSRGVPVRAVVVLWGRGVSQWPEQDRVKTIEQVTVVVGPALAAWLEVQEREGCSLTGSQVDEVWKALEDQVTRRDSLDAIRHPMPTSLIDWLARSGVAVASAAGAVLVVGRLLSSTNSTATAIAMAAALTLPAIVAIRVKRLPALIWAARAWVTVMVSLCVALAVADGVYRLM